MSEIMNNSYVRLMAPYETDEHLLVKYYVKRQVLLGIYNKKKHTAINLMNSSVSLPWIYNKKIES